MSGLAEAALALHDGWAIGAPLAPLGAGLINDTYLAANGSARRWVLQRLNRSVFADPEQVMHNVGRVVRHLGKRAPGLVPNLVQTGSAGGFHVDDAGDYWRLWDYVEDAVTLQSLGTEAQARSAGEAFARFQNALDDLPAPRLRDPIEGFMRLGHYLEGLDRALESAGDPGSMVLDALAGIERRRDLAGEFQDLGANVHGDCKVNNLLFRGDRACCIVDLDTVMFGHWAWDFGDLVRSAADEDGRFSMPLFRAVAAGFHAETHQRADARSLVLAPRYVGVMLAVRFLTDHLVGDSYFKVARRGENLERGLAALELVRQMEAREAEMLAAARAL